MAYDEGLAQRIREYLENQKNVEEKKMFGGLCFLISRHMCCGIVENKLMARVGAEKYNKLLKKDHARVMDFTGKPMRGMIYVEPEGVNSDEELSFWLDVCINFIHSLPPKK